MLDDVKFISYQTVELVSSMGDDLSAVRAARVSTGAQTGEEMDAASQGLIGYLMREKHASPFEHASLSFRIDTPIFVAREFMRHRTLSYNEMCLAADTKVYFESESGNGRWKPIGEHYDHWHHGVPDSLGRRRKIPSIYSAKVRSFDEVTHERTLSSVVNVVSRGVQTVYKLRTARGFEVKATASHLFFTASGWQRLGDLKVGDETYVQHRVHTSDPEKRIIPHSLRQAIQVWTATQRKAVVERDGGACQACGSAGDRIDHRVPVAVSLRLALDVENLQTLCRDCDREKTSSEQALRDHSQMKPKPISLDRIVSIDLVGREATYDLVLEGNHNFLGNGLVVHNSGRYRVLEPTFYIPPAERPLVQVGKPGHYEFEQGLEHHHSALILEMPRACRAAWEAYYKLISQGVAKEVARMVLPVNIFTSFYATGNLRNWFNFLALRSEEQALYEIRCVAHLIEEKIAELFPVTYLAWTDNGRGSL